MKTPTRLPSPISTTTPVTDLRRAISDLAVRGVREVTAVRDAFIAGIPPLQTVSSGSAADFVTRFGSGTIASGIVRSTAQFGLSTSVVGTVASPPKPEIDFVEIDEDRFFGTLDSFYTKIRVSLSKEDVPRVSFVRLLRAANGPVKGAPRPAFSAMMDASATNVVRKNNDPVALAAFRAAQLGVGNKLTDFIVDDTFSNQRSVVSSASLRPAPAPINTNRQSVTSAGLVSIANVDRGVLESLTFYVNQRTMSPSRNVQLPLQVAQRQGLNVLQGSTVNGATAVVQVGNSMGFTEIARLSPVNIPAIGSFVELDFYDPAVVYGGSYTYYAVCVDSNGVDGPRSRIVKADVLRIAPPTSPAVLYNVVSGTPRFAIRCSGSYIDHIEVFRRGGTPSPISRVLSADSAAFLESPSIATDSGFFHVGDVGVNADRSTTFVDRNVTPGDRLDYRFYTVDSFGFKSSTPFSCSMVIPDRTARVPLLLPVITAEHDDGRRVRVTVHCDDERVTQFVIGRREVHINEGAFRQPDAPDYFTLGVPSSGKRAGSRLGPTFDRYSSHGWVGVHQVVSGSASFVDRAVEFDRVYQYSARALDVRGNSTADVSSQYVHVSVKPVSDAPTGASGTVLVDEGTGTPRAVLIEWNPGTIDFRPDELIGDQDVLAASMVRTVFQVERREEGHARWKTLPATTESYFIDPVSDTPPPKFRPEYAKVSHEYHYRVIAMQSGAYLSTYTEPVQVAVLPTLSSPGMVWVRSTPSAVRPVHLVVSWSYLGEFVDSWEVQRAIANKIFGSKVFSMDSVEARGLPYETVAIITRESSRARGISAGDSPLPSNILVGNRFFLDPDVGLENSYFYRVRALDARGNPSDWSYAGISLTDSPFDRKFFSALSDDEKVTLSLDPRPIAKWRNG